MGRRNMKRMIIAGLAGLALAAAPLAAQASVHTNATTACHAEFSQCATPVIAVSSVSANNLTPADDFALSYAGPTPAVAYGNIENRSPHRPAFTRTRPRHATSSSRSAPRP